MKTITILLISFVMIACVPKEAKECTVERVQGGTLITCPGTDEFLPDGKDGKSAVIEVIDPCGDDPGEFDEILLRISTGELLTFFEDGKFRFIAHIGPGQYRTTDRQRCEFTVTNELEVQY